jgi:hypothetical protein
MSGLYTVQAYNTARESENKIHDDSVARRFGFTGGLVPGVDVFGYIAHLPVARWGRAWLEHGTAECRFKKPVYDGETATLTETPGTDNGISITVESLGVLCATADAWLPDAAPATAPAAAAGPDEVAAPPPAPDARPPADEQSLAIGRTLSMRPLRPDAAFAANYLRDLRETDTLFAREDLLHPGLILRLCNWTVSQNVVLGPWIHVGSRIQNLGVAHVGEELTVFARVTNNEEHKGHKFFYLDALVRADGRPVARIAHTAIYEPRQVQEAA